MVSGININLFDFQEKAVIKLLDIVTDSRSKQTVIVKSPTGSGKTIILIDFIEEYLTKVSSSTSFIWLCPGKGDLEEQSRQKMCKFAPHRYTQNLFDALQNGFDDESTTFINWELVTKKGNTAIRDSERKNLFDRIAEAHRAGTEFIVIIDEEHSNNTAKAKSIIDAFSAKNIIRVSATAVENYREKLWAEHTKLSERYPGYKDFIAWGRDFLETTVLPELKKKNDEFIEHDNGKGTTAYFWIHNNAPHEVKEALRILEYSGLIYEDSAGIRATRSEIGTRYMVNIGCLLAIEATPATSGMKIIKESDIRRMSEYGANYPAYQGIQGKIVGSETDALKEQLEKSIDLLELTDWQKQKMHEISIDTIGDLISAPEEKLKQAKYIADVRARTIKNAGIAAVCEYLLG